MPHLFKHTYLRLFPRSNHKTASSKEVKPHHTASPHDHLPANELEKLTRILLLLQPDLVTLWNARRNLILKDHLRVVSELKFSELVLQLKPKSASTFNYREWLFSTALNFHTAPLQLVNNGVDLEEELLSEQRIHAELTLSLKCCEKYERNYYAWSHRAWVFQRLIPRIATDKEEIYRRVIEDLQVTQNYLEANISDYSCCHFRHNLFRKIAFFGIPFEERYWEMITREVEFCDRMLKLYEKKECFLLHRRAMLSFIFQFRPHDRQLCEVTEKYLFGLNRQNLDVFPENSLSQF